MHSLLFLEFLGTTELLVVLVVALIIFGPRKLPELGRSLGSAMRQFRDASDSFKRTWETEALMANNTAPTFVPAGNVSTEETSPEPFDELVPEASTADGEANPQLNETIIPDGLPAVSATGEARA